MILPHLRLLTFVAVVPVSDLREVILFDSDITCNTYKKDVLIYRPKQPPTKTGMSFYFLLMHTVGRYYALRLQNVKN